MERLIVNHQRRRNCIKSPKGFISDHIIPYCISLDDSKKNIQFLTKKEHNKKMIIDFKILRKFRKLSWTEKITNYSIELKKSIKFLKEEYLKEFKKISLYSLISK